MRTKMEKMIMLAPLAILGILAFIAIGGTIVMLLWNWLLPPLFGWSAITFWQALGLLALCRILFGGFSRHSVYRTGMRQRIAERMAEKERFRQRMRETYGSGPASGDTKGE